MTHQERMGRAKQLSDEKNWDAGVHPTGVVIYFQGRIWRVVGGTHAAPSMIALRGVRVADVEWVKQKVRKDPDV